MPTLLRIFGLLRDYIFLGFIYSWCIYIQKRYCIKIQIIGLKNSIFFCFAHFFQKYLDMFIIFCTFAPS